MSQHMHEHASMRTPTTVTCITAKQRPDGFMLVTKEHEEGHVEEHEAALGKK